MRLLHRQGSGELSRQSHLEFVVRARRYRLEARLKPDDSGGRVFKSVYAN